MSTVHNLTSWIKARYWLGCDDDSERLVESLIKAATGWIEAYTSRKLASRAYTEDDLDDVFYDGDGSTTLFLSQRPVTEVSGIYIGGLDTSTDNYVLYPNRGKIALTNGERFTKGNQTVKVLFTAGYVSIPEDLETACLILVEWWFKTITDKRVGVISKDSSEWTIRYEKEIPLSIVQILESYKKSVVA
jgi:hypothetical protein